MLRVVFEALEACRPIFAVFLLAARQQDHDKQRARQAGSLSQHHNAQDTASRVAHQQLPL